MSQKDEELSALDLDNLITMTDRRTLWHLELTEEKIYNISQGLFLALKEIDKKKNRKRNLISANVGVFTLYFMCVYGSIQMVLYTIHVDLGTRQFIVSLIADLGLCIITPAIVLYNAPTIRS